MTTDREYLSEQEGAPYEGRREGEERRDVFSAEVDFGASVFDEDREGPPVLIEPVFRINGSGEHRGGSLGYGDERDEQWRWGTGTGLRVSKSSIPALMRVLADLLDAEVTI